MLLLLSLGCAPEPHHTLRVLAASSLQEGFTELGAQFEAQHPDTSLELVFAGSQTHAAQLRMGLRADLLASADTALLGALEQEGLAVDPHSFAQNQLVLAGPEPLTLRALPEAGRVVLGTPSSPIGGYTDQLLSAAGDSYGPQWAAQMDAAVRSRESNTRLVLAKVSMGEADAAVVYATDLQAAPQLVASPVPAELAPAPTYAIAPVDPAGPSQSAQAFLALLASPQGAQTLQRHGFTPTP